MNPQLFLLVSTLTFITSHLSAQEIVSRNKDTQIVGGNPSKQDSRPWQVALVSHENIEKDNSRAHFCGGTIIGKKEILTAAHCVKKKNKKDIQVLSGTQSLKSGGKRTNVVDIVIHPDYNENNLDNDIAILKLESSPSGRSIATISPQDELKYIPPNAAVTVIGWGNTQAQGESYPTQLMEVQVPVVLINTCFDRYKKEGLEITENMLCAGYKIGKKDACQGDSGGPLVLLDEKSKAYTQVGIVSWGGLEGEECAFPENYGVYTRLSRYLPWINSNVSSRCTSDDIQGGFC